MSGARVAIVVGCVLWLATPGCSEDAPPAPEVVEAPTSPEAQLEAVRQALADAERDGRWLRAEVLLETLMKLEPERDTLERRVQLRRIRRHRQIAAALDEVAALLDNDAWRAARSGLDTLERLGDELTGTERARIERLRELSTIVEGEVGDSALIERPAP